MGCASSPRAWRNSSQSLKAAQVPHLLNVAWPAYIVFAVTLTIVLVLPRFTKAVPAPLVAIVLVTAATFVWHIDVPTVALGGTLGGLPDPTPLLVPLDMTTLTIIWPTALSVAFVGLLETLLTAKLVDDITETRSNKSRESWALGVANIAAGFYGGIAGCAMIGQTVVNVRLGCARTRISTIVAGLVLLLLVTSLSRLLAGIPMAALAAVMMIVAVSTVDWRSVTSIRRMPLSETAVMIVTVIVVVATGNLAFGVVAGVALALVLLARRLSHVTLIERTASESLVTYAIDGPLFFASSAELADRFSYAFDPQRIVIDLSHAQLWDATSVSALDAIRQRFVDRGSTVEFVGLDARSIHFRARVHRATRP